MNSKIVNIDTSESAGLPPSMPPRRIFLAALIFFVIPALATLSSGRSPALSGLDPWTIGLVGAAVVARVLLASRRGFRLLPILDLPLLGLVFVATGGEDSPFDPALFLVYSLLALFLEREPRRLATRGYVLAYCGGVVAMYGILLWAVWQDHSERLESARRDVEVKAAEPRLVPRPMDLDLPGLQDSLSIALERLRAEGQIATEASYFDPTVDDGIVADAKRWFEALSLRQQALEAAHRATQPPYPVSRRAVDAERELTSVIDSTRDEISTINDRWQRELTAASSSVGAFIPAPEPLTALTNENELLEAAFRRLEELEYGQNSVARVLSRFLLSVRKEFEDLERGFVDSRRALVVERLSLALLVLATLALVAGLRAFYEDEVRRRESARAESELLRKQQETENWIAVTAGFTHTIGNDILAYDAISEEALEVAEGKNGDVPPQIVTALRFIRESNKQRVGFIRFLEEFARMRKQRLEGRPFRPESLAAIDLEKLLREERAHVGRVEVLDMPPASADSRVARLRAKFEALPLEVVFTPDDPNTRRLSKGRAAVLQFFAYELFKNALRNGSGNTPLRVEVRRRGERVSLKFINDLEIVRTADPSGIDGFVRKLPRLPDRVARSDQELVAIVEDVLASCFEPHVGGGTGLGLFLIRYFVSEYYAGSIRASLHDVSRFEVAFELDLPDDLSTSLSIDRDRT